MFRHEEQVYGEDEHYLQGGVHFTQVLTPSNVYAKYGRSQSAVHARVAIFIYNEGDEQAEHSTGEDKQVTHSGWHAIHCLWYW